VQRALAADDASRDGGGTVCKYNVRHLAEPPSRDGKRDSMDTHRRARSTVKRESRSNPTPKEGNTRENSTQDGLVRTCIRMMRGGVGEEKGDEAECFFTSSQQAHSLSQMRPTNKARFRHPKPRRVRNGHDGFPVAISESRRPACALSVTAPQRRKAACDPVHDLRAGCFSGDPGHSRELRACCGGHWSAVHDIKSLLSESRHASQ
jgi:hypothetical protein